jgi:hypothetical protein
MSLLFHGNSSPDWPYISEYLKRHGVDKDIYDLCFFAYDRGWDAESNGASVPWRNTWIEFFLPSELDLEGDVSCYLKNKDGSLAKLAHPIFVVHDGLWKNHGLFWRGHRLECWTRWEVDQFLYRGMKQCHFPVKAVIRWLGVSLARLWLPWD